MNKIFQYGVVVGLFLVSPLFAFAQDQKPDYVEAVQRAVEHASSPTGWLPASLFVIPDTTTGTTEGLTYDSGNLIVRTETKSRNFKANYVGQAGYKIYGQPKTDAAWVTTGNDATKFLQANGVTSANVTTLLERGLGMNDTGTHDAIVEYAVDTQYLLRPTRNPDIRQYLPGEYGANLPFVQPAGMSDETFNNFKTYYDYWKGDSGPNDPHPFPWTQLGYTFFWGNGYGLDKINGMSEFILLGQTPVQIHGIYATQSYIYTLNKGGVFSTDADAQYGNGFASFQVDGSCDTLWAGHRFQKNVSYDTGSPNQIIITPEGSVSGGQGILVWSLNYNVENHGDITGGTGAKFGIAGTENIAVLFKGDTSADYGTPVTEGMNSLVNYGTISSPGTAVQAEAGDTFILNRSGGSISGDIAAIKTGAGDDMVVIKGGRITGDIDLGTGFDVLIIEKGGKVTGGITTSEYASVMVDGGKLNMTGGRISAGGITGGNKADVITLSGGVINGGISTGGDDDKVTIKGGMVSGSEYAIKTGDGADKIKIKGGTVSGGEYAIRTGKDADRIVFKGGEIAGRIDMGDGNDTLTVKGSGDPRFSFTLDRNNATAGQIVNTEAVSIAAGSGATIAVTVGATGNIRNNDRFLIVEADTLDFDPAQFTILNDGRRPMVTFSAEKTGSQLSLVAARDGSYYGRRGGNVSLGAILDFLAENGSEEMSEVLGALDGSGDPGNARQLEPNAGGGILQAGFGTAGLFHRAVVGRIDQVWAGRSAGPGMTGVSTGESPAGEGVWGRGFGAILRQDSQGNNAGYQADVWGGSFGYDRFVFDHLLAGFGGGYARNQVRSYDDLSLTNVDSYQANVYGSLARDAYHIDALLSFAYNFYKSSRHIAFGGIDRTARGDYSGQQYSLLLEGGYDIQANGFVMTPLASVQVMRLHINGYTEEGAGALDLSSGAQDYNFFETGLGAKLAYPVQGDDLRITPEIHAKWLYDFAGDRQQSVSRFSGGGASY